jgi:ATP-dependent RNA circularization protein (DNA/RNA ligase family)
MSDFYRFPHTPHLSWFKEGQPRDAKVLSQAKAGSLLAGELVVEEKVDGANLGFSTTEDMVLRIQSRGGYLDRNYAHPQFGPLWPWLAAREAQLVDALWPSLILFGEWCYAVHTVVYDRLPDWYLGFDIYDRAVGKFWDTARRDELLTKLQLHGVPRLGKNRFSLEQLTHFLSKTSFVGGSAIEGLVVRQESDGFTRCRAKLVRAEFFQAIDEHWSRRPMTHNKLTEAAETPFVAPHWST